MTKYHPSKDLPDFARQYKTLSPSKLADVVLMRRNEKIKPEAVTMWFSRHQDIHDELAREIVEGLPTEKQAVDASIFERGSFEKLESVKNWLVMLNNRELTQDYIDGKISILKSVCMGKVHTFDLVAEGKWVYKHPDRLHLNEVMELISMLKERGIDTYPYKRDLKDFLESKGEPTGKKIVVGHARGKGKFARLFVPLERLNQMLEWLKTANYELYVLDNFMFKTGTRVTASLNALIEDLSVVGNRAILRVYDKARRSVFPKGHPWDKYIDPQLLVLMKTLIGNRTKGKIFTIPVDVASRTNRIAIQRFAPETLEQYPDLDPNHFWRHMFAQHMLRKTNWAYAVVANLGGWTVSALEESYGKPPEELIREWAKKWEWGE
jgi:integrase